MTRATRDAVRPSSASVSAPPHAPRRLAIDGRVLADEYHGIGRFVEMLLRRLLQEPGLEITVFVRPGQRSSRFDIDALIEGLGYARADFDLPLASPLQWLRWPGALRLVRADLALFPYSLGAPLFGPGRRFAFIHDCIMEAEPQFAPSPRTRLLYMLHTALVAHRTLVLTRSAASGREIERFYRVPIAEWQVIPGGVDPDFCKGASACDYVGGVRLPRNYVLHVGARRPHKNVATLVRALAQLPEHQHLVLVGTVDRRFPDVVPQLARSLRVGGRVLHLPHVSEPDLHSLYAGASVFAFPSFIEGLGLPLLEAMAAGVPVIASDIPVFREIAGDAAILVPAEDPAAWANAILLLSDRKRRELLVTAGRKQVQDATWDVTAARLLAAIKNH